MIDGRLLAAIEADTEVGHILDAPHAGAPLVIAFGFVDWVAPARFDFARRLMKLEAGGLRHNRLLVRDTANLWYQHGVAGLGLDVDEVAAALSATARALAPASITCVGQSMGAYAAILFGCKIGADRVLAFGPLSHFSPERALADGDRRWLPTMQLVGRHPPARRYDDLKPIVAASRGRTAVHIVHGTASEADGSPNPDAIHANRLATCSGVTVTRIADAPHAVVDLLVRGGALDRLLADTILAPEGGEPTLVLEAGQPDAGEPLTDDWRGWIFENLARGGRPEDLLAAMADRSIHVGAAQRAIDAARRSPYLDAAMRLAGQRGPLPGG